MLLRDSALLSLCHIRFCICLVVVWICRVDLSPRPCFRVAMRQRCWTCAVIGAVIQILSCQLSWTLP